MERPNEIQYAKALTGTEEDAFEHRNEQQGLVESAIQQVWLADVDADQAAEDGAAER